MFARRVADVRVYVRCGRFRTRARDVSAAYCMFDCPGGCGGGCVAAAVQLQVHVQLCNVQARPARVQYVRSAKVLSDVLYRCRARGVVIHTPTAVFSDWRYTEHGR